MPYLFASPTDALSNVFHTAIYPIMVIILFTPVTLLILWMLRIENVEKGEPPVVRSSVPFIGHMIGMLRHHNNYFTILSKRYSGPIYTVKIFAFRIYIIQSPELAQAAFRQSKEIDFDKIRTYASSNAIAFDAHGKSIVTYKAKKGERSYRLDIHPEMVATLAQGPSLLETNARVLNYLAKTLAAIGTSPEPKPLFRWLRDSYTLGSAEALYGAENPLSKDPSLIQSVWDFEKDLGLLALNYLPRYTAPKGYAARLKITPAFEKYYNAGLDKDASDFVQGRNRIARQYGLTTEEISKADLTIIMAAGTNTVPNVFYMLCNIFSRPELVSALRDEVSKITAWTTKDGVEAVTVNISKLQSDCPLLTACFHETMRLTKTGASVRTALTDVMLNDEYLLKQGAFIQIPTGVLQADVKTWGPDAKEFNPEHFITRESLPKEAKKAQAQAFIPFGGGKNLCPGRHLAFTEIAAFVAIMVHGFEMTMSNGSKVQVPEGEFQKFGVASISPKRDPCVLIKRRNEFEGVVWKFEVGKA